jgi:hypothetical protein
MIRRLAPALVLLLATAMPAAAEVPSWLSGAWATAARLTAPDGAQIRIRCTLDAGAPTADTWAGTLGCATVQGRFEGQWQIAIASGAASGAVAFTGPDAAEFDVTGSASAERVSLRSADGQGVGFAPGPDGALIVEMDRLGPQRLTGALTFETR